VWGVYNLSFPQPVTRMFIEYSKRLQELYNKGGMREVLRGVRDYIIEDILKSPYADRRSDNTQRGEFIKSNLSETDATLIDVECAEGELTALAGSLDYKL